MYIENSDSDAPLIYGEFDTDIVRVNGDLQYTGLLTFVSDARLKDVKRPFTTGLKALAQLQPAVYRYKTGNDLHLPDDQNYVGIIAQDLQTAIPEAVEEEKGGYMMVHLEPILWTVVNSIKELQAENARLRADYAALSKEVAALRKERQKSP